jgi:prepilin-type N-terminal cleavage/methylation domain-containing protein
MKKRSRSRKGFSLVEMVISLAILGMIMTPIYTMLIMSKKNNIQGETKQTAALYGQEVFEEIKSEDIEEIKDSAGNTTELNIGDIKISPITNEGSKDFGNGYKAKVTLEKNPIDFEKKTTSDNSIADIETVNFTSAFDGEGNPIKIKLGNGHEEPIRYLSTDEVLKVAINAKTIENKKIVEIKDMINSYPYEIEVNEQKKNNQINLTLNFDDYKVRSTDADSTKLRGVQLSVYNQDNIPLNICLQKSADLEVDVDTKLGNVRIYDNRSDSSSKAGQLYNVNVEVIQTINNEDKIIFTGQTSQNIKVN